MSDGSVVVDLSMKRQLSYRTTAATTGTEALHRDYTAHRSDQIGSDQFVAGPETAYGRKERIVGISRILRTIQRLQYSGLNLLKKIFLLIM
ncbi:hypothetical protein CI109_102146 [Kwoniella shandongensis]|uniref:Uncharacterized protein n=1 Tax=Kwoniella shandongensis TaxID=1734106 RepID=A0AAJ8MU81_9TREE